MGPDNALDSDADGLPDFLDIDADNDGILDLDEGNSACADTSPVDGRCDGGDADGDGVVDARDGANGLGVANYPARPDTDNDLTADWRDRDADGDGISDLVEGISACADAVAPMGACKPSAPCRSACRAGHRGDRCALLARRAALGCRARDRGSSRTTRLRICTRAATGSLRRAAARSDPPAAVERLVLHAAPVEVLTTQVIAACTCLAIEFDGARLIACSAAALTVHHGEVGATRRVAAGAAALVESAGAALILGEAVAAGLVHHREVHARQRLVGVARALVEHDALCLVLGNAETFSVHRSEVRATGCVPAIARALEQSDRCFRVLGRRGVSRRSRRIRRIRCRPEQVDPEIAARDENAVIAAVPIELSGLRAIEVDATSALV